MKSRYIFNALSEVYAGTIEKMARLSIESNREFFLFNGIIYHVTDKMEILYTKLTEGDIIFSL